MMNFRNAHLFSKTRPRAAFGRRCLGTSAAAFAPIGEKSAYTDKQLRQAHHIEENLEDKGVPHGKAVGIAWATVNKIYGGGLREKGSAYEMLKEKNPDKLVKELEDDSKLDRLEYVRQHTSKEHASNEDLWATKPPHHVALEDYLARGGRVVSEHPNIRGQDYHTIVVELPEGRRQAFSNVKTETLQKILQIPESQMQFSKQEEQPQQGQYQRPSRHIAFEDYLNQGAKIVSEHPNIRGNEYHTVVLQLPNGGKQSFANVKSDTLERLLGSQQQAQWVHGGTIAGQQAQQGQAVKQGQPLSYGQSGRHKAIEDYLQSGGWIVSEHPNIRGQEYHTVVVELPDGHRQAFANIKTETLEQILKEQKGQPLHPGATTIKAFTETSLEEFLKQGANITMDHVYPFRGDFYHTLFAEHTGQRLVFENVKHDLLHRFHQQFPQQVPKPKEGAQKAIPMADMPRVRPQGIEQVMTQGGKIVSEHPNIRGQDYHTVWVDLPDGRRNVFTNVKSETLERLIGGQSMGKGIGATPVEERQEEVQELDMSEIPQGTPVHPEAR